MCGITGLIDPLHIFRNDDLQIIITQMTHTLHHRGPDDSGIWVDERFGVALGHRRLSILDLSPEGQQPMISACGRFVLTFNGEIYNFQTIRNELVTAHHRFRGNSDTEVMLAAFAQWGIVQAIKRFIGMFAFALWDRETCTLTLARDRVGEKPLYYGWGNQVFLFGSELKALRAYSGWEPDIDRNALALFMRYCYVPTPYSIYHGICKLPPGTILTLPYDQAKVGILPEPVPYWSAQAIIEHAMENPFDGSEDEASEQLEKLLNETIARQMIADVPLGAFLSGGIDSSTVVAIMQAQSKHPVKTFTIGNYIPEYDEARDAKRVANYLGTDHTELYITPEDALAVVPHIPRLYDEPFADSSQIPSFLIAQLTRRYVTVSLSGDGGDELFGGYNRYRLLPLLWRRIGWIPTIWRYALSRGISAIPSPILNASFAWSRPFLSKYGQVKNLADRIKKGANILAAMDADDLYHQVASFWKDTSLLVKNSHPVPTALTKHPEGRMLSDFSHHMMALDLVSYLPDDILVKVDRAAMGVSLETRIPFLDQNIIEFAWKLPYSMKFRQEKSKWLVRKVLYKYIPEELVERPKSGFDIPLAEWLCGPLREWAEALLNKQRLEEEGFLYAQPVRQKWEEHLNGSHQWHYYLWNVLMFQSWLEYHKQKH